MQYIPLTKGKFAIVDDEVVHDTGEKLVLFLLKRFRYMKELFLQEKSRRRYLVFNSGRDFWKLLGYIVYSVTLVGPLWWSVRGYLVKRDVAWFVHPVMCIGMCMVYGIAVVSRWVGWL